MSTILKILLLAAYHGGASGSPWLDITLPMPKVEL